LVKAIHEDGQSGFIGGATFGFEEQLEQTRGHVDRLEGNS